MDGWVLGAVLAIYAVFLWVLMFYVWRKGYREWRTNRANRLEMFSARIMDRREKMSWAPGPEGQSGAEQYVLFEYDGNQKEFRVDSEVYAIARIGREGTLYTRGGRFETVEPKSDDEQADELYRRVVGR